MTLIVSDTSPLNYLILIGAIDILPKLLSRVILPEHVYTTELQSKDTPDQVRKWVDSLPAWVEVRSPSHTEELNLDQGETEAIALAVELHAPILLDEREAREVARQKGLLVTGTVGVLERAAERGLLHLPTTIERLRQTNAHLGDDLLEAALDRDKAKRQAKAHQNLNARDQDSSPDHWTAP